ncbi:hydroxyproline O-galactosyltransferase GALT5 [Nematostella vectensis]|nr:hydroxyproline O-galactosyltransferase GALT5 [Nematostella vectensis]
MLRKRALTLIVALFVVAGLYIFTRVSPRRAKDFVSAKHVAKRSFDLKGTAEFPRKVRLFVAVLTHAKRKPRRDAIRDSWFKECNNQAICRFFSDEVGLSNQSRLKLANEGLENKDVVLLPPTARLAFTERLLLVWEWVYQHNIQFDYFLRIDDDHFLCLGRLLYELKHRPLKGLYWGFLHCHPKVVRIDEAWLLLSADLVEEVLARRRDKTLVCTPYGDQAVAIWINQSKKNVTYFIDNKRIVHKSAGKDPSFFNKDICEKYMSLHGTYPKSMRQFWLLWDNLRRRESHVLSYQIPKIEDYSKHCAFSPVFDYTGFISEYQFKPKLCHENPTWSVSGNMHAGREDDGERYSNY